MQKFATGTYVTFSPVRAVPGRKQAASRLRRSQLRESQICSFQQADAFAGNLSCDNHQAPKKRRCAPLPEADQPAANRLRARFSEHDF